MNCGELRIIAVITNSLGLSWSCKMAAGNRLPDHRWVTQELKHDVITFTFGCAALSMTP